MMKKILVTFLLIISNSLLFSQNEVLPEGWDKITLEGETAYMNLITGDVSTKFPTKAALKKKEIVEYDPTITHKVKKGETLSVIARKYNKSLAKIYQLNSLENFDAIKIGQEIVVGYTEKTEDAANEKYEDLPTKYYKVESGDSLYRIAKKYNISVAKLKSLNGLKSNTIKVGQQLIIKN